MRISGSTAWAAGVVPHRSCPTFFTLDVIRQDLHFSFGLINADKDDDKFVDCAIASNAKCIVTEDKHFKVLETIPFPKVEIVGIDAFKSCLEQRLRH